MTRKQARKQSVGMCQTMTLSVIAFLFVFAGIFSAQLVRAEEGDTGVDTSSEVSDSTESSESSESTPETSEESEEVITEDAPETTEEEAVEEVASVEVESDDSEVVLEEVTVDVTSTDEESTSDTVVEEVFEMFSSFAPMLISMPSSARITAPAEDDTIHGVYTFTAEYNNPDYEGNPGVNWAIRSGADETCAGGTSVFGNVDGLATSPAHTTGIFPTFTSGNNAVTWTGSLFTAVLDFTGLSQGEYCFVFNPNPVNSHRQNVKFFYEPAEEECVECEMGPSTLVINKNVIDKDGNDISDGTEFTVTVTLDDMETRAEEIEIVISEEKSSPIELMSGRYLVCEVLEEGSDYELVDITSMYLKSSELEGNCRYIYLGTEESSITFVNQKLTEEEIPSRRSSRRHIIGGQVLGAFTGDSSTGGSCGMYLNSYMRIGANNNVDDVMKLQAFLNEQGYPMPVNGVFGATTEAAVKAFQKTHAAEILAPWGITDPTGYVYKMTRYVMNNMVCPGSEAKPTI